ncbi:uncharacterized protein LOC124257061 isoform X2 [Haliotis rubra]|nr:uncharacterized protein LOC124257061 isoform X2 [Haliotis rubra]
MAFRSSQGLVQSVVIPALIAVWSTDIVYGDNGDTGLHNFTQRADASVFTGPFEFLHIADADSPGHALLTGLALTCAMLLGMALMVVLFFVVLPRCSRGNGGSQYGLLYNDNITSSVNSISVKTV